MESPCFLDVIWRCGAQSCCSPSVPLFAATHHISWFWIIVPAALVALGMFDLTQQRHAILRNYPLWGHLRFLFEFIRPEIRQYFVEDDTDEKPFSRAQRSIVYQRAKNDVDSRPYGTRIDVKAVAHEWISHSLAPTTLDVHDFRIVVGPDRAQPYSMSIFNVSAMSFGSLSAQRDHGAEPRREERQLRARHRRRLDVEVSPRAWRRHHLGDRLGLLRLP